ncbi:MAG: hypothetical protein N5P05_002229 [Chroococcopsis gigantea SAG 12.99]|jgi:uncharacterized RDD family membrane protein YckC|nr:hypothetical protein [Chroococcopsis gigantea SAG 12.99]
MYPNDVPEDKIQRRFPKVPIDRRAYAFGIDFVTVWFLSSFAGVNWAVKLLVFLFCWLLLRVVVVDKNKGQSLGRWALDMKVINLRFRRVPTLIDLAKREVIVGGCAGLAMLGLNAAFNNPLSFLILCSFLLVECGLAIGDEKYGQAFHDRVTGTVIIGTRRGFSLDIRMKQLWWTFKGRRKR